MTRQVYGPRLLLAAFSARTAAWHGLTNNWRKLLKAYAIPYSHVLEMRRREPPFQDWNDERLNAFGRAATALIEKYCSFGLTVGVDREVRATYASGMPPKTSPDSAYGMCARHIFEKVPEYVERVLGLRHARMNFVFERQDQRFGDAERIFHELKEVDPWFQERLGTITSGEAVDYPGLQAADLFAYFARRKEPHANFGDVPEAGPIFKGLKRVPCPLFRVNVTEEAAALHHQVKANIAKHRRYERNRLRKSRRSTRSV